MPSPMNGTSWVDIGDSLDRTSRALHEAEALIAALKNKNASLMEIVKAGEWQPIDTAPKDGTHIQVGTFPAPDGAITITTAHWYLFDGEWALSVNRDGEHSSHGVESPTHWRPLPAPPQPRLAHPEPTP